MAKGVLLTPPTTHWECSRCTTTDVTHQAAPHTRFHTCRSNGLTMPMVQAGLRHKVEIRPREDYVGKEVVQTDADGRPVMSVVTTRDDGQDCAVFAPVAVGKRSER